MLANLIRYACLKQLCQLIGIIKTISKECVHQSIRDYGTQNSSTLRVLLPQGDDSRTGRSDPANLFEEPTICFCLPPRGSLNVSALY